MRYPTRKRASSTKSQAENGRTEHVEQREFVSWFRKTYPYIRIIAIPNGGQRNIVTAARLKAEGVVPGVPDLFIPAWLLWIEMKKIKGGSVSQSQRDWHNYLHSINQSVIIAKGFEDAKSQLQDFEEGMEIKYGGTESD